MFSMGEMARQLAQMRPIAVGWQHSQPAPADCSEAIMRIRTTYYKPKFLQYGLTKLNCIIAMKHHLPPLDSLKPFESAARNLSFTRAGEELCLSKGAVSYQIKKLEEFVQASLFLRTVRQVSLTDEGKLLLASTQSAFLELGNTFNQLKGEARVFDVSVAATTYVASRWLSPRIASFSEKFPDVAVSFRHAVNAADFKLQDVDIAMRWGECTGQPEPARLLELPMPLFPACSPQLLRRLCPSADGPIAAEALLAPPWNKVPLLCEDRGLDLWTLWLKPNGQTLVNPRRVIGDANVRVQAAIDGQGLIMEDALIQYELDNGLLVAPFADQLSGFGYALLNPARRFDNAKARALCDWLVKRARSS
jgi:DNA-binding transcriptional LysR family regulator